MAKQPVKYIGGPTQAECYSFGPSVTWPIFQGGAIVSNIRMQEALRDQAFITYQETVLAAFQDVENALIAFNKEQEHYKSLKDSVAANTKAVDLSLKLYTEGLLDFLNVLVAQRSLYTAEDALVAEQPQHRHRSHRPLQSLGRRLGNHTGRGTAMSLRERMPRLRRGSSEVWRPCVIWKK